MGEIPSSISVPIQIETKAVSLHLHQKVGTYTTSDNTVLKRLFCLPKLATQYILPECRELVINDHVHKYSFLLLGD